jgi:hypothetical protein
MDGDKEGEFSSSFLCQTNNERNLLSHVLEGIQEIFLQKWTPELYNYELLIILHN